MDHPIYRVTSVEVVGQYVLRVGFDDGTVQVVDLQPMLAGELFAPLQDRALFDRVRIDPEVKTLVWPNGADLDPATLHDWPRHAGAMAELAKTWERGAA